jgi:TniQ
VGAAARAPMTCEISPAVRPRTGPSEVADPAGVITRQAVLPRRLSHVVAPRPGEAFASWVDRVAADLDVTPGQAALALGMQTRQVSGDVRPVFYGLALTARSARAVQAATGLPAGVIAGMQLARFGATALDLRGLNLAAERSLQPIAQREWLLIHGSRACPACLAQDSAWPLWWRLGIAAACPIHGLVLLDRCPACGIGLRRGYAGAPRGLSRQARVDPRACGNYSGGRRCVQVLAELPAQQAAQVSVHAQRRALHAAHGEPVMVAGMPVGPREWFAALRYLSAMIRFAGDGWPGPHGLPAGLAAAVAADSCRDGRRGGTPAALSTSPPTAALAAAVLTLAAPILGARSPQEGAVLARPLIEAVVARRRERRHNPLSRLPLPPCLAASLVGLSVTGSRVVQALPAARMAHGFVLSFRHIPQLLDPVSYRGLIAGQLPGTAATSGRRLSVLALARYAGASSWAHAGSVLGLDPCRSRQVADVVGRRIGDATRFWAAIAAVAKSLATQGVDYAARRAALASLVVVSHALLFAVCSPLGMPVTPARCRHAAAWIWAELTSGDIREAPAYRDHTGSLVSLRETSRRFVKALPAPVAAALRRHGHALLVEAGCS